MKVFVPKSLIADPKRLTRAIDNGLNAAALGVQVDFNVTTQTWAGRPEFVIKAGKFERYIYTLNKIYKFVSGGTRVRYATMTPDFGAKTAVGKIASFKGRGGMAYISKRHPRPGIKAREFAETIQEKWKKELPQVLQRAIDSEVSHNRG
jgi:hypothetical protein